MFLPSLAAVWRGTMLAIGFAAALPASAGDVRSHAKPAKSFAEAIGRAQRMITERDSTAMPGGQTILLSHGRRTHRAIVLLHGLSDSPRQFQPLADSLFADGANVLVPRLPRHSPRSGSVGELAGLTPSELCHFADEAIDIAAGLGDSVMVMGLSVGGTLAAWAAEHRKEVARAVAIAPAFAAARVPSILERPLVNLSAHLPNVTKHYAPDPDHPDRAQGFATHGLAAVIRLGMAVRADAGRARPKGEVLFVTSARDRTVKSGPVLDLAREWRKHAVPVSVYEFPDSLNLPHNVLESPPAKGPADAVSTVLLSVIRTGEAPAWVNRR